MKSLNCSKTGNQTPPWLVKHFKKSFESLYVANRRSKSTSIDINNVNKEIIPKMIYLPPKEQINLASTTVPKHLSSVCRSNTNSSFKISVSKSASNGNLFSDYSQLRTPEKYLEPLSSDWKAVDTVAKFKRGRSTINLRSRDNSSPERSNEIIEICDSSVNQKPNIRKLSRKYIKGKFAKFFRSTGKLNESNTHSKVPQCLNPMNNSNDASSDLPNDALRNLSFTAAMMAKDAKSLKPRSENLQKIEDHTKQIPSSTLRFWKKPCEEKIKASQRRTQDNIYGSSEVLLRINPGTENTKISSVLSLFSDEINGDRSSDFGKFCNMELRNSVTVAGYDKAFQRYQSIINQSQNMSRKDRTLSVAYDSENVCQNTNLRMRSCQSSGSVNTLTRSISAVNANNDDGPRKSQTEATRNQYTQKICPPKRSLVPNSHCKVNVPSVSPPAYDRMVANNRRSRPKVISLAPASSYQLKSNSQTRFQSNDSINRQGPKPPPRSDSLIRSFELICKNLQTSISEPRGDSFKIFKNQNDYQAWLKNLPYHNPDKITTLLRLRSKVARRQCVSELLNFGISDLSLNNKRRHSWPLLQRTNIPSDDNPSKRTSSLSRVKNKNKKCDELRINVESPSLCNYSRLYCLRNSSNSNGQFVKAMSPFQMESIIKQRPVTSTMKTSALTVQNRKCSKHRPRQENVINSRMTESCHETESFAFI